MSASISHLRAIGYALGGFTLWVLMDVCMKLAGESDISPYEIVGFMGLTGGSFLALSAISQGGLKELWPKRPRRQLLQALLAFADLALCATALKHLPLTMFYVTVFLAPMIIAILANFFLKESLTFTKIVAIVVGFIGALVAINPFSSNIEGDWIGYTTAVIGTLCFAISITSLRVVTQSETVRSMAFFSALVQLSLGFGLSVTHPVFVHGKMLLVLLAMGMFSVLANLAQYRALKSTTAANVAQTHYSQIVTGGAFGFFLWHDPFTLHLALGSVLIIGSGLFIAAHARAEENLAAIKPPDAPT